jgi:pimeloyl-ACP methyl ester carboxylesterase
MPYCKNKNHSIYYEQHGSGKPVVLIHGAAVSFQNNYATFGWIEKLNESGLQVIGLDLRGHGKSGKPLDVESYGTENLASDVLAVMDELELNQVSVVGYSLGSVVALHLVQAFPQRFSKAALVATGDGLLGFPPHTFSSLSPLISDVLSRSEYPEDLPLHLAAYWNFVTASGGSKEAISIAASANYPPLSIDLASKIQLPILVVSGENDPVLGQGPRLANTLPKGTYIEIKRADHFNLAVMSEVKDVIADYISSSVKIVT